MTPDQLAAALLAREMIPQPGPSGEQGERGPAGLPGVKGDKGEPGADGKPGVQGSPGRQGDPGRDGKVLETPGSPGPPGRDGTDGKPGSQGVPGHNGADSTVPGPQGDKGLNWRGKFDGRLAYAADDAVEFNGSSYVATASVRGTAPPGSGWDLLAQRGQPGLSGGVMGGGGLRLEVDGVRQKASALDLRGPGVSVAMDGTVARATFGGSGTGAGLPPGGNPGQIVTNIAPGAGDWQDPTGGASAAADITVAAPLTHGNVQAELEALPSIIEHLDPLTTTPEALINALIAHGYMEAS